MIKSDKSGKVREYSPFGDEWTAEILKNRKADIVFMFKFVAQENMKMKEELKKLKVRLDAKDGLRNKNEDSFKNGFKEDNKRFGDNWKKRMSEVGKDELVSMYENLAWHCLLLEDEISRQDLALSGFQLNVISQDQK